MCGASGNVLNMNSVLLAVNGVNYRSQDLVVCTFLLDSLVFSVSLFPTRPHLSHRSSRPSSSRMRTQLKSHTLSHPTFAQPPTLAPRFCRHTRFTEMAPPSLSPSE